MAACHLVRAMPPKPIAYPALARLLAEAAISTAAATADRATPGAPPCARLRTHGSMSLAATSAAKVKAWPNSLSTQTVASKKERQREKQGEPLGELDRRHGRVYHAASVIGSELIQDQQ